MMNWLSLVTGAFVALSVIAFVLYRMEVVVDIRRALAPIRYGASVPKENPFVAIANAIERPEAATLWIRSAFIVSIVVVLVAVVVRFPLLVLLVGPVWLGLVLYSRSQLRAYRSKLAAQTRVSELMLVFLSRAGASVSDALHVLSSQFDEPLNSRLKEVEVKSHYATLPIALQQLADSTGVQPLADFASLVGESEQYGTPIADAVLRSYRLEARLRENKARKRFSNVSLELALISMGLIAFPGFGFIVYALLQYILRMFTGAMI